MKIGKILASAAIALSVAFVGVSVPTYAADTPTPTKAGGGGSTTCPEGTTRAGDPVNSLAECNIVKDDSLMPTVQIILNVILSVLGIVAVAVIILGGVQYVTSTGDPAKTKKAKDTILYGIIGLIVALLGYAIVNFVLSSIWGSKTK